MNVLALVLGEPPSSSEKTVYGYEYRYAEYGNDLPEWIQRLAFDV